MKIHTVSKKLIVSWTKNSLDSSVAAIFVKFSVPAFQPPIASRIFKSGFCSFNFMTLWYLADKLTKDKGRNTCLLHRNKHVYGYCDLYL